VSANKYDDNNDDDDDTLQQTKIFLSLFANTNDPISSLIIAAKLNFTL